MGAVTGGLDGFRESQIPLRRVRGKRLHFHAHACRHALPVQRDQRLIALLAGMAAQAIAFLEQANIVTALDETVWDTSWIFGDSSFPGRALHTLIGYVDQPTAMLAHRLCGNADGDRGADEAFLRAGGAASALSSGMAR